MNIETGEIRRLANAMELEELQKEWGDALREVPPDMYEEADKALMNQKQAFIDLKSDTPLANYAKKERKAQKNKRKMAKESRKRNR